MQFAPYILAAALAFSLLAPPAQAQPVMLTFGVIDDGPSRLNLQILKVAYAKLGVEVRGEELPAKRSLEESGSGVIDGEVVRIQTVEDKYPQLVRVPTPMDTFASVAVTYGDDATINGLSDLRFRKVGIRSGFVFAETAASSLNQVVTAKSWDTLFELLMQGRVDAIISTPVIIQEQAARLQDDGFTTHAPPLATHNLYHFLHSRHARLVPVIAHTLDAMRESGEMDRLRARLEASGEAVE